ncbi:unnamed protein product [Trifolium pratense]|uniref:Uncharacterized protein n=1 Tax=Trifolium pratense TaxID=57577 RepID=A0ACB0KIF8_TRIPR|nr:unnamed protein product [Trifolium pratense]
MKRFIIMHAFSDDVIANLPKLHHNLSHPCMTRHSFTNLVSNHLRISDDPIEIMRLCNLIFAPTIQDQHCERNEEEKQLDLFMKRNFENLLHFMDECQTLELVYEDLPQQKNIHDCGIYVLKYLEMWDGDRKWEQQYWEFNFLSKRKGTKYTPKQMLESMGRVWALERDMFHYSLCPRDRYSLANMNEYGREWDYRMEESRQLRQSISYRLLKKPTKRSLQVPRDTDESLEMAIKIVRHENNQMQIRINRYEASSVLNSRGTPLRQYITYGVLTDDE